VPDTRNKKYSRWNDTNENPEKTDIIFTLLLTALLVAPATCSCAGPPQPVPDADIYHNSTGIAVDSAGNILLTIQHHTVRKYSPSGDVIGTWGSKGEGDGQFSFPLGIGIDRKGFVYVTDSSNSIQKFSNSGTFVAKWNIGNHNDREYESPYDVAVNSNDNVYVTDFFNSCVLKFNPDGKFLMKLCGDPAQAQQVSSPYQHDPSAAPFLVLPVVAAILLALLIIERKPKK